MNQPCGKSELSLFDLPFTQITHEKGGWVDVYPISSLEGNRPIEFSFNGLQNEYLDLNDTMLYIKYKVTKSDGTDIPGANVVTAYTPANLTIAALFNDVTLTLNEVLVESGHQLYPFKALMKTMLQFDENAIKTHQAMAGYNDDSAERKEWIGDSNTH